MNHQVRLIAEFQKYHRVPAAGGRAALASRGAGGAKCKLTPARLRELEAVLEAGPAASGWDEDQCWTLARIAEVIRARFKVGYTLAGVDLLLHRIGWSVQVLARRAADPDGPPAGQPGDRRVGFQNSAAGPDLGFYAARSYSLMRPPRTGRRWIRLRDRSATG